MNIRQVGLNLMNKGNKNVVMTGGRCVLHQFPKQSEGERCPYIDCKSHWQRNSTTLYKKV